MAALLALLPALLVAQPAQGVVQLISFTAVSEEDYVIVEWVTRGEVNNEGFYVQRSTEQNTGYTRVSELLEGMIDYPEEMGYEYIDLDVVTGITYWYRLEVVDLDGTIQLSNPISVTPGVDTATTTPGGQTSPTVSVTTPTLTTETLASTATATTASGAYPAPPTQSGYPGPIQAPPPGATAVPVTPTAGFLPPTPTQAITQAPTTGVTIVVTGSQSLAATATLIPLPEITMIFPQPREAALLVTATPEAAEGPPWKVPQRIVPLALVFLIWVILGGWFYYSQRIMG